MLACSVLCRLTKDDQKMSYELRETNLVVTQKVSSLTGQKREHCREKMKDMQTEKRVT